MSRHCTTPSPYLIRWIMVSSVGARRQGARLDRPAHTGNLYANNNVDPAKSPPRFVITINHKLVSATYDISIRWVIMFSKAEKMLAGSDREMFLLKTGINKRQCVGRKVEKLYNSWTKQEYRYIVHYLDRRTSSLCTWHFIFKNTVGLMFRPLCEAPDTVTDLASASRNDYNLLNVQFFWHNYLFYPGFFPCTQNSSLH